MNNSGHVSFAGLLLIVFITLKLTNVITWSWLWVLAPVWIPLAITVVVLLFVGIIGMITTIVKEFL